MPQVITYEPDAAIRGLTRWALLEVSGAAGAGPIADKVKTLALPSAGAAD